MAVEIKELVIRAIVDYDTGSRSESPNTGLPMREDEKQELIQECVKQVLKVLKKKQQR